MKKKWIKTVIWHWKHQFDEHDIIIYSDAATRSVDWEKIENNIKYSYFDFVWEISKYMKTIAIAGTHWKTTTTAMCIHTFKELNIPNFWLWVVWWLVKDLNYDNYFLEHWDDMKRIFDKILIWKCDVKDIFKKYYFIIEACEFNNHFLLIDCDYALITNIDWDHKDTFPSIEDYTSTFEKFMHKVRYNIIQTKNIKNNLIDLDFQYIFGKHNVENANLVIKLIKSLWHNTLQDAKIALENFWWIKRRQEYIGQLWNIKLYSDYAHHPQEIKSVVTSFRANFPDTKLIWIFQPHQIYRLLSFKEEFIKILKQFDCTIIYNIYSVRESHLLTEFELYKKNPDTTKEEVWDSIAKSCNWVYVSKIETLIDILNEKSWIWVLMTAWDLDFNMKKLLWKKNEKRNH